MMHADRMVPGWFPDVNRNHLIYLIRTYDVQVVLEVGAFLGKSTVFFAERCRLVYSVDFWDLGCLTSAGEKCEGRKLGLPNHFRTIWEDNVTQARNERGYGKAFGGTFPVDPKKPVSDIFPTEGPDLVYIDGSHTYDDVLHDIKIYGSISKKIVCGDDYQIAHGVTKAVEDIYGSRLRAAPPFWWVFQNDQER